MNNFWMANHSWVIGAVTVIAMSYSRFNTPPTSRSSTTWARYHMVSCFYTLTLIVSWIVLASTPDIVEALTKHSGLAAGWKGLALPVYAAVLVTVLASVAPFSTFDSAVRRFFQRLANIPWEAQRLSSALRHRTWIPEDKLVADVRDELHKADFSDEDISFSCERTPQALWTRITTLYKYIETWETRRGAFSGFYFNNLDNIRHLMKEYRDLEAHAHCVFPMLKPSKAPDGSQEFDQIQKDLAESFLAAAKRLEENLCDLVSRGILTCGLTARARSAEFEKIGFMINVAPDHLLDHMVGLYVCLTMLYVGYFMIIGRRNPILMGIVLPTNFVGAILTAFWFKRWEWARREGDNLPITGYVVAALAACLIALLTSFSLGVLTGSGVVETWNIFTSRSWPWSLMAAFVAALVSYLIDQKERPGMRWKETVGVALGCALWSIPVVYLLHYACSSCVPPPPPYWRVMIVSALTGSLIGFFVPTWHRSPLKTVSWYERFKVVVTTRTDQDGGVVATIDVFPPQALGIPTRRAEQLHPIEAASTDDAIAEAVRSARAWINNSTRPQGVQAAIA
jgi:hypothetical protein